MNALVLIATLLAAGTDLGSLAKALRARDPDVREAAVRDLSRVPGPSSLRLLVEALADEDPFVRDAAERFVRERKAEEDLALLRTLGLAHRSPAVRGRTLAAVVAAGAPFAEEALGRALADPDPGVREAAVRHVVPVSGFRGLPMLAAAALRGREGRPRAAALEELDRLSEEEGRALAGRLLDDPEMEPRSAAVSVLGRAPADTALPVLFGALADSSWSVRVAAYRALAGRRDPSAIPVLIRALAGERGRLRDEAGTALAAITGVGLPPDPGAWGKWWEREKDRFSVPPEPASAVADADGSAASFHSIPVRSECMAFLLDRSRSMDDKLLRGDRTTKAALVEEELSRTFGRLDPPARFLLVAFGTTAEPFQPKPVPASAAARRAALEWFCDRPVRGRTNLYAALEVALSCEDVDTVFVLTDGAPSAGEYRTSATILAAIADLNRWRRAVIHTVEVGREATGRRWDGLLAKLAAAHGGVHVRR